MPFATGGMRSNHEAATAYLRQIAEQLWWEGLEPDYREAAAIASDLRVAAERLERAINDQL